MKNNKGISLITLIVMIVIMIILASIGIRLAPQILENTMETKAEEERKQVINAVSGRFGDYQRNSTANPIVGLMIPEENLVNEETATNYICNKFKNEYGKLITEDEIQNSTQTKLIQKFVSDNFDDMEYTRILEYTDLIELEIEYTNLNAVYLVNYYSNDVIGPIS